MKLSLVIVNFHSFEYIQRCLASVDASWCSQVVLVDNSSDPLEADRLTSLVLPVTHKVIIEPDNLGFGAAANDGIRLALRDEPDHPVWLVNPDMTFPAETPIALIDRLSLGVDDILSPVIVSGEHHALQIWFAGGAVDQRTGDVVHDDYLSPYDRTEPPLTRSTSFMCGAAPVFTRDAWIQLGGFRDDLFLYWEDAELSLRAQDARLRMTVLGPADPVWHAVGGTGQGSGQSEAFYYYSARNRVMIMRQRNGWSALARPRLLIQLIKFVLRPVRRERSQRVPKSLAALRGYFDGVRSVLPREPSSRRH